MIGFPPGACGNDKVGARGNDKFGGFHTVSGPPRRIKKEKGYETESCSRKEKLVEKNIFQIIKQLTKVI